MKRIAIIVASIVALGVVALGTLVVFPPKGWVKGQVVERVKKATGRDLVINGPMSLRVLPRVVLRLEDVVLSNPPGPPREPLFAARVVLVEMELMQLWPLFLGRGAIDRLSLEEPRVALSYDPQGQLNWTQGGGQPITVRALAIADGWLSYRDGTLGDSLQVARIEGAAKDIVGGRIAELTLKSGEVTVGGAGPVITLKALDADAKGLTLNQIGEITLKAGKLLYRQGAGSEPVELEGLQVTAKSISGASPLDAEIAFIFNKDRVAGKLRLQSPAALLEGKPSPLSARVEAPKGKFDVDGSLALVGGAARLEGKAGASAPSLRGLARWARIPLPETGAFGAASAAGSVKVEGKRIALDNAQFALDDTKATGSLAVDLVGERLLLSGKLAADAVDVDSYLEKQAATPTKKARVRGPRVTAPPAPPDKESLKVSLQAQLAALDWPGLAESANESRARALAAHVEWSDEAVDLSGLKKLDADLWLSVNKLTVRDLELGVPELKAVLKDGALSLDAKNVSVEGGRMSGTASVDVREAQPKLATKFKVEDVDALAVFETIEQNALIAGPFSVEADLRGSGNSVRKLVDTLTGRLKAKTSKGAIVGYDLHSDWGLFVAWLGQYDANRRTPFEGLEADVALANGVASKSSVEVAGPIFGVTANGILRLPSREIDYRAQLDLLSLGRTAAVHIFGGWLQPKRDFQWVGSTSARSLEAQADPPEALKDVDLKDPELARLAGEVIKKSASRGVLPPQLTRVLEGLKARAEGRE